MYNTEDIKNYYNTTQIHYEQWWDLNKSFSLHYGIWDEKTKNFNEALANTNKILTELANINSSNRVLDAGCGVGGAAVFIHEQKGARVTGITLSQKQLDSANKLVTDKGLSNHIDFKLMDYTQTTFPDESFDVIWACESICHSPEPKKFMNEAHRLLKKGGRLVICDFFKTSEDQIDKNNWLQKWCDTWAVTQLNTSMDFKKGLEKSGFANTKVLDYTPQIQKSAQRMYYASLLAVLPSEVYKLIKPGVSKFARNHYKCGLYQYKALKANLWKYQIILSIKNN